MGGFGGAVRGCLDEDNCDVLPRLRNGLSREQNQEIADSTQPTELARKIVDQIKRLPLVRSTAEYGRSFRILALDGGGIRGAFTAAVLARWAQMLDPENGGQQFARHFDLIAGTSTGAILAVGLALGRTPADILQFYREKGPQIFEGGKWTGSKYKSETLKQNLIDALGESRLSEARCRLVIPTVRAIDGCAKVFVTPHSADRGEFRDLPVVDAAMASTSAPTYFDDHTIPDGIASQSFLDGGLWANNPVLAGISEAVGPLGIPLNRIDVLSVGTLHHESDFSKNLRGGKIKWAPDIAELFFAAQSSAATQLANHLLSRARHLRVNQQTPFEIKLDATDAIDKLSERGSNIGAELFDVVRSRFLDGSCPPPWNSDT